MSLRNALMVALMFGSSVAWAGTPADVGQGLGTAQPLTNDVSLSPHFHLYRFIKQGIEYLQVNDATGQVRMAVGVANGTLIVLPVGVDAQRVSTSDVPLHVAVTGVETVYKDTQVTLSVGVSATGALVWSASPNATCDPNDCGVNRVATMSPTTQATPVAEVCDPNDCAVNRVTKSLQTTSQTPTTTPSTSTVLSACDPNDCPVNRGPSS